MIAEMQFNPKIITLTRPLVTAVGAMVLLLASAGLRVALGEPPMAAQIAVFAVLGALLLLLIRDLWCTARDLKHDFEERNRLETSQERLMTIMEEMPATVIMTDADGRIQYVNGKFEELTGWRRSEALGETPSYLQYGEIDDATYRAIQEQLAAGDPWRGVLLTLRKDGSAYRAETTLLPLKSPDGTVLNLVGIGQDIVEEFPQARRVSREL